MTFLELLSLIAGGVGFLAAFMEGRKTGVAGTLIGLILGLGIGFGLFWGMRVATKRVVHHLEPCEPKLQLILGWFFLLVAILWMCVSGLIASWLTGLVIHLWQR